jgi:hypothetical protein
LAALADHASKFASVALANVVREYPNHPSHVLTSPDDARTPRSLHPAFYGSYDWHSCVHMHWLLARLWRSFPDLPERDAIARVFDTHFTPDAIATECEYLARPEARSFERTYGWAWLLKLATELDACGDARARRWSSALAPLASAFVERYREYLPKATYPIRYGIHPNSAFGVAFALDYARATGHRDLEKLCGERALAWFAHDRDAPAAWEPSGSDFLSPSLIEADLMRRVLDRDRFGAWLAGFLPGLARSEPATLFESPVVTDVLDPQIVHLCGLAFSRAWCFRGIAAWLRSGDRRIDIANDAADRHLEAGLAGMERADYLGTHWLASFAALAFD